MRRPLRVIAGFLIAPLVPISLTILPNVLRHMSESRLTPVETVRRFFEFGHFPVALFQITILCAVLTTIFYGLLLLTVLRMRNWLRLMPSIVAGTVSGALALPIALLLHVWQTMPDPMDSPLIGEAIRGLWFIAAMLGAGIAMIIWSIARPDRA